MRPMHRHFQRNALGRDFARSSFSGGLSRGTTEKAAIAVGVLAGGYVLYKLWGRRHGGHLVGVGTDCGPGAYWDEASAQCVPLSLPAPPISPIPACPPGQFYDYFQQMCVPLAGARHYG